MRSKIAVFYGAGKPLQLEECEIPALCQGEVLVKNEYVTLCRSDISTYTGKRIEKTPTILGHEIVGRVVALGEGNPVLDLEGRPLAIGERVTWAIYASNPDGEMARRGIPQKAPDLFKYGHEQLTERNTLHGGLAEYTLLRRASYARFAFGRNCPAGSGSHHQLRGFHRCRFAPLGWKNRRAQSGGPWGWHVGYCRLCLVSGKRGC